MAISVEISRHSITGVCSNAKVHLVLKRPVTISEQNRDRGAIGIRDNQIGYAILIEVGYRQLAAEMYHHQSLAERTPCWSDY
jgi:hypothetical protein